MKTLSSRLQVFLERWVIEATKIVEASHPSMKFQAVELFTKTFAPKDLTSDDLIYFQNNLANDEVNG